MTQRSPIAVLLMTVIVPFYALYWAIKTKDELNAKFNTGIPTAWLLLVPIVSLFWMFKFAQGVQKASGVNWILTFLFFPIGAFLAQGKFNELGGGAQARAA
jgi:hypothetical protein